MDQLISTEGVVFLVASIIAVIGALGVVGSRNPVHAALSLVATLFGVAVLFFNQNAQFLGVVQIIVYTGAIVVLILFVIMLLGVDTEEDLVTEPLVGQRFLAGLAAVLLVFGLFSVFLIGKDSLVTGLPKKASSPEAIQTATTPSDPGAATAQRQAIGEGNIDKIGSQLFTNWVLAFEITAVLLTIAVVGAVLLARRPDSYEPLPEPEPIDVEHETDEEALA